MIVKQIPEGGRHFDIFDGDKMVASIMNNERLAHLFAASDEMLRILKGLDGPTVWLDDKWSCVYCGGTRPQHNQNCLILEIRELVERIEQ